MKMMMILLPGLLGISPGNRRRKMMDKRKISRQENSALLVEVRGRTPKEEYALRATGPEGRRRKLPRLRRNNLEQLGGPQFPDQETLKSALTDTNSGRT